MILWEPCRLGDVMGVGLGEARGEIPLNTASQIQRGSLSIQSTPTEHWKHHSCPDGAGATPDTLSIAPPHPHTHTLDVLQTRQRRYLITSSQSDSSSPRTTTTTEVKSSLHSETPPSVLIRLWMQNQTSIHTSVLRLRSSDRSVVGPKDQRSSHDKPDHTVSDGTTLHSSCGPVSYHGFFI